MTEEHNVSFSGYAHNTAEKYIADVRNGLLAIEMVFWSPLEGGITEGAMTGLSLILAGFSKNLGTALKLLDAQRQEFDATKAKQQEDERRLREARMLHRLEQKEATLSDHAAA